MSLRYGNTYVALGWLIAANIYLLTSPALGQTQEPKTNAQTSASETQQTKPVKPPLPKQEQDAPKKQTLCEEAKAGPESDLCQQWRMASAAEKQVYWTSKLYNATMWEIGALVLTLLATATAAIRAIIAARAAQKAVKVTSDTAQHQLRAYITAETTVLNASGTEYCWELTIQHRAIGARKIGIGLRIYGPFNGADDGCYHQPEPV